MTTENAKLKLGGMTNKPAGLSLGFGKLPPRIIEKEAGDGSNEARALAEEGSLAKKPTGLGFKIPIEGIARTCKPNVFLVKPPNTEGQTIPVRSVDLFDFLNQNRLTKNYLLV